jgi:hypothetical protein
MLAHYLVKQYLVGLIRHCEISDVRGWGAGESHLT